MEGSDALFWSTQQAKDVNAAILLCHLVLTLGHVQP